MRRLLTAPLPLARSLAGIARELLQDTRAAAATQVSDLRSQVEDLWQAAGEMLPRPEPARLLRRMESALEALRTRDAIVFPGQIKL